MSSTLHSIVPLNRRTGCMLCYPFEQARLKGHSAKCWNEWPVAVQPKLNGERCRWLHGMMLSSTEHVIHSVPHIKEALTRLSEPGMPFHGLELDGELYVHGMPFDTMSGIHSIVSRTQDLHSAHATMQYHVFDLATDQAGCPQAERLLKLQRAFRHPELQSAPIKLVPFQLACCYDEVVNALDAYVANGYEGIIVRRLSADYVRRRSTNILKFKPAQHDDYEIVDYLEEHSLDGTPKNRLGCLICRGATGALFSVYSGFDDGLRQQLWDNRASLVGRTVTVRYQALTQTRKVPMFGRVDAQKLRTTWSIA